MKITMYELLGLVKDGKAPKKIKFYGVEWEYTEYQYERIDKENLGNIWNGYNFNILNDEVEILEEEKKIPEKLTPTSLKGIDNLDEKIEIAHIDTMSVLDTVNEIIDYLKSKGE